MSTNAYLHASQHVSATLDGYVTLIGGRNAQGKSAVIQGIDVLQTAGGGQLAA